jgi:hypothetical protein
MMWPSIDNPLQGGRPATTYTDIKDLTHIVSVASVIVLRRVSILYKININTGYKEL